MTKSNLNPTKITKKELHDCIVGCITLSDPPYPTVKIAKLVDAIWGQPFDGETEKITPQPISTAPSGQRILLYCKRPIESEGWWQIGMMCPDVHRWIDDDCDPDWMLVQPSYWMPLPPQPTPTQPQ